MASAERQTEETRIRRILEINSFDLVTLEKYLVEEGYIPNSTDEQAARDAVYRFRQFYSNTSIGNTPILYLFDGSDIAENNQEVCESESAKYEAVRDLIYLIATRKAQATVENRAQEGCGANTAVNSEET